MKNWNYKRRKNTFVVAISLLFFNQAFLFAQSVSLPTDRARIHVEQITDPTDTTKKLKVLRTDANTPLRGASPWITNKSVQANDLEISASFFRDQANENLNSVRIIWFQAWFDVYARQNGTLPNPADITDFSDSVQVKHCLEVLDSAVNHASVNGMYACINFHTAWKGPVNLPYALQFWSVVAPYFANRTNVIFEMANEVVAGSNSFTVANDRDTVMNSQVEMYKLIRNAAADAFVIIMTPPSCEGDFSSNNDFIKGVVRFESLVGPVDWSKTAVGYHTYYLGWDNATNTFAKSSVPMRAIHRAYPAMSTEVNWPEGVVNSLNSEVSLDGEQFQVQTHERLGLGWWIWAVSHPDNSAEGWYANFNKLKNDAMSKGYFWKKDQLGEVDNEVPSVPQELVASSIKSNRFNLKWIASTDNIKVNFYALFNGSNYLGSSDSTSFDFIGLKPDSTYSLTIKAVDNAGNISDASTELKVKTLEFDALIPFTELAPIIDGTKELSWTGSDYNVGNLVTGSISNIDDLNATWTAVYDNANLYFFVDVKDDTIIVNGPEWYLDDRIEIFIDADGDRSTAFTDRDYQYYIRPGATKFTETHKNAIANIVLSNVTVDGGYRLEAKIPFATLGIIPESGWKLGIDVIVADDDGGNEDAILVWNNNNGSTWTSPTLFGMAKLGQNPDVISPEVPTSLAATGITASGFTLTWIASSDNIGVTGYEVFKDGISVGKTITTSLAVKGLTASTSFEFTVKARDAAGNWSATSNSIMVSTLNDIALNKAITTSSDYSTFYSGAKAVDGSATTQWRSISTDLNPWITIDFGAVYTLNSIKLTWSTNYAKDYLLEISTDGVLFSTIKKLTAQNGAIDELAGLIQKGRYLRLTVNARSSTSGVSLISAEVYGTFDSWTSISEVSYSKLEIYPNPASSFITIKNAPINSVISITSIDGKIVSQELKLNNGDSFIDVRNFKKGLYILAVKNGNRSDTEKIVIK